MLNTPLPEKFEGLKASPESRYTTYTTEQATINQLITYLAELTEVVEGKQTSASDDIKMEIAGHLVRTNPTPWSAGDRHTPTLKETLMGEIQALDNYWTSKDQDKALIRLKEVEAIINRLIP